MSVTRDNPQAAAAAPAERPAELEAELANLRELVQDGPIAEARALIKEIEAKWPDDESVRYWARVLPPPTTRLLPAMPPRSFERENAWIRAHAAEYPGQWLAISGDRLVAASPSYRAAVDQARAVGEQDIILWFQPARW